MARKSAISVAWFALTIAPLQAAAPQTTHLLMQGLGASLGSFSIAADGCTQTFYNLMASQTVTHNTPGGKVTSGFVTFSITTFNFCTFERSDTEGYGDANISGDVKKSVHVTASVTATVSVNNGPPTNSVPATIDLTLTPTSAPERTRRSSFFSSGGSIIRTRSVENDADASVSGTWIVNGTDYLPATQDNALASVSDINSGYLDIVK